MADPTIADFDTLLEQFRENREKLKIATKDLFQLQAITHDKLAGSNGNKPYPYKKKE